MRQMLKKEKTNYSKIPKIIFCSIDYLSFLSCLFLLSHSLSSFSLSLLQITSLSTPFKSIVVLHNQDLRVSATLFTESTLAMEIGVVDIEINYWRSRLAHGFCNCDYDLWMSYGDSGFLVVGLRWWLGFVVFICLFIYLFLI